MSYDYQQDPLPDDESALALFEVTDSSVTQAVDTAPDPQVDDGSVEEPSDGEPQLHFSNVDEFVHWLAFVYRRRCGESGRAEYRWDAAWWRSPEVHLRMDAMWRAFEAARHDPGFGISSWLRDHCDYHMGIIMSPDGPFAESTTRTDAGEPLPVVPMPWYLR